MQVWCHFTDNGTLTRQWVQTGQMCWNRNKSCILLYTHMSCSSGVRSICNMGCALHAPRLCVRSSSEMSKQEWHWKCEPVSKWHLLINAQEKYKRSKRVSPRRMCNGTLMYWKARGEEGGDYVDDRSHFWSHFNPTEKLDLCAHSVGIVVIHWCVFTVVLCRGRARLCVCFTLHQRLFQKENESFANVPKNSEQ